MNPRAKRSRWSVWGVLLLCLVIGGCGARTSAAQVSVYNDSAKIAGEGDSFTFADKQGANDANGGKLSYRGFSGMLTVWSLDNPKSDTGSLKVSWKLSASKGKTKLVYLPPDGTVQVLAEGEGEGEITLDVPSGASRIKLVGQKAKGSLSVELTPSDSVTVTGEKDFE